MTTKVIYRIKGNAERREAHVPDGEFYTDWIAQREGLDNPNDVVVIEVKA